MTDEGTNKVNRFNGDPDDLLEYEIKRELCRASEEVRYRDAVRIQSFVKFFLLSIITICEIALLAINIYFLYK